MISHAESWTYYCIRLFANIVLLSFNSRPVLNRSIFEDCKLLGLKNFEKPHLNPLGSNVLHCKFCFLVRVRDWPVLWGSKISQAALFIKSLVNGPDFKWDLESRSPTIGNTDKWLPFCQNPFEIQTKMTTWFQIVWFSNGWDYSYSHS